MKILNKIDFPMIMSYKDTENPNFEPYNYFLNGHNDVVFLADSNFTEGKTESYEYNPWGVLLTQANKNNLLYTARDFDFDTALQFNRMRYYNPLLARFTQKDLVSLFLYKLIFQIRFNNPISYSDPLGLYGIPVGAILGILCGTVEESPKGNLFCYIRWRCGDPRDKCEPAWGIFCVCKEYY